MKERKTTQEDFDVFKTEVMRLLDKIHMADWGIYFDWCLLKDCGARCTTNTNNRTVTFALSTKTYRSPEQMKHTALHEVCHFIIAEIADLAYLRFVTLREVEKADEMVAERLRVILMELGL